MLVRGCSKNSLQASHGHQTRLVVGAKVSLALLGRAGPLRNGVGGGLSGATPVAGLGGLCGVRGLGGTPVSARSGGLGSGRPLATSLSGRSIPLGCLGSWKGNWPSYYLQGSR